MQRALLLLRRHWSPALVRHYMYPRSFIQFLKNEQQPDITQLDNGLHVATLKKDRRHVCIGLFADAGSRYENECENGVAHMFEHMVFKATKAYSHHQLTKKINRLGIKLHAYTSRELVTYTAQCLTQDLREVFLMLNDCIFNNALDCEIIRNEKCIIYEEILNNETDAKNLVFDYLHATAFQGTGLARSVLGLTRTLYDFNPTTISQYMNKMLNPCRMCLCAVGDVDHNQLVCLANACISRTVPTPCTEKLYRYTGSEVRFRNDAMPKAHVAFALEGPPFSDLDAIFIDLACVIIGGWDVTQPGGEDNGVAVARRASGGKFCDAYKAFNLKYSDTSLWGAQFVATSLQHEDMLFTLQDIMLGMCTMITEGEFERAKEEMKTKLLYETQSCYGAALDIATHVLYNQTHWPTLYDRLDFIDNIKMADFKSTMYEYVYNKCPVVAAVGPTEGLPDYNRIRSSLYWARV